jgi:hypothetical protein
MDSVPAPNGASRNDRARHDFAFSRRICVRALHQWFALIDRGRRECRVRAAPAVSCAKCAKRTHTSIQVQRRQSGIPCAMVLTTYNALSSATNSCLSPSSSGLAARRVRSDLMHLRGLDTSNGCQDHTPSPHASAPFVSRAWQSLTGINPPCDSPRAQR